MSFVHHFQLMANYNLRMNTQVYGAASKLTKAELTEDMDAFFKSILGTLNHIMVGDLFWLNRFAILHDESAEPFKSLRALTEFPKPTKLDQVLFNDFEQLIQTRIKLDSLIKFWLDTDTQESDFQQTLTYHNSKGELFSQNFGELVSHLFNHQTHHRGQVSSLLSQKRMDVGVTDFLVEIAAN